MGYYMTAILSFLGAEHMSNHSAPTNLLNPQDKQGLVMKAGNPSYKALVCKFKASLSNLARLHFKLKVKRGLDIQPHGKVIALHTQDPSTARKKKTFQRQDSSASQLLIFST